MSLEQSCVLFSFGQMASAVDLQGKMGNQNGECIVPLHQVMPPHGERKEDERLQGTHHVSAPNSAPVSCCRVPGQGQPPSWPKGKAAPPSASNKQQKCNQQS